MTDLRLEREFKVSPARLFAAISTQSDLLQWWGPEGIHVPVHDLDLSRTGPWRRGVVYPACSNPAAGLIFAAAMLRRFNSGAFM